MAQQSALQPRQRLSRKGTQLEGLSLSTMAKRYAEKLAINQEEMNG
jgi:hypothetical protein